MKKTTQTIRKPDAQMSAVLSVSMPRGLLKRVKDRIAERGYGGPSAYLQELVRRDVMCEAA